MSSAKPKLRLRRMTDAEIEASRNAEPIPVACRTCQDNGIVLGDSVFVNTEHSYGVEYIGASCPDCELGREES